MDKSGGRQHRDGRVEDVRFGADLDAEGVGHLNARVDGFTLSGGAMSAFDADGSALVVHAAEDDLVTDPTGNSGGRIACGVIVVR